MQHQISHETLCALHRAIKSIRFMSFGKRLYPYKKDVKWIKASWQRFQQDPLGFLADCPEGVSRDILSLAGPGPA